MRSFLYITFILLFLLQGCGKRVAEDVDIPPGILPPHQFAELLVDFALAESAATMNIKSVPVQKVDSVYAFNPLNENGVRKTQYDSTILFYSGHPEIYKTIYDTVLVRLAEYKALRNVVKADSTAK